MIRTSLFLKFTVGSVLLLLAILATSCAEQTVVQDSRPQDLRPRIYVGGQITHEGVILWTNGMTVSNAIVLAGGLTPLVSSWHLQVRHWDGSEEKYKLDKAAGFTNDVTLEPGDRIFIPYGPCF
jgi:hypothetical protein